MVSRFRRFVRRVVRRVRRTTKKVVKKAKTVFKPTKKTAPKAPPKKAPPKKPTVITRSTSRSRSVAPSPRPSSGVSPSRVPTRSVAAPAQPSPTPPTQQAATAPTTPKVATGPQPRRVGGVRQLSPQEQRTADRIRQIRLDVAAGLTPQEQLQAERIRQIRRGVSRGVIATPVQTIPPRRLEPRKARAEFSPPERRQPSSEDIVRSVEAQARGQAIDISNVTGAFIPSVTEGEGELFVTGIGSGRFTPTQRERLARAVAQGRLRGPGGEFIDVESLGGQSTAAGEQFSFRVSEGDLQDRVINVVFGEEFGPQSRGAITVQTQAERRGIPRLLRLIPGTLQGVGELFGGKPRGEKSLREEFLGGLEEVTGAPLIEKKPGKPVTVFPGGDIPGGTQVTFGQLTPPTPIPTSAPKTGDNGDDAPPEVSFPTIVEQSIVEKETLVPFPVPVIQERQVGVIAVAAADTLPGGAVVGTPVQVQPGVVPPVPAGFNSFIPEIVSNGETVKASPIPLNPRQAVDRGAFILDKSTAGTLQLRPSTQSPPKENDFITKKEIGTFEKISKKLLQGPGGAIVENPKFALDTPGERRGVTGRQLSEKLISQTPGIRRLRKSRAKKRSQLSQVLGRSLPQNNAVLRLDSLGKTKSKQGGKNNKGLSNPMNLLS